MSMNQYRARGVIDYTYEIGQRYIQSLVWHGESGQESLVDTFTTLPCDLQTFESAQRHRG